MSVIAVHSASQIVTDPDQLADTRRRTPGPDGGYVPAGLAGYTWDGAAYCPDCASEVEVTSADDGETYTIDRFPAFDHDDRGFGVGIVSCTDEWDYPGAACHECHKRLDTNVLIYDDGGAHPDPVVRVRDPDGVRDPVTAFVLEAPEGDDAVRVILAEDFGANGDAGDMSWIPRTDVVEGLEA